MGEGSAGIDARLGWSFEQWRKRQAIFSPTVQITKIAEVVS